MPGRRAIGGLVAVDEDHRHLGVLRRRQLHEVGRTRRWAGGADRDADRLRVGVGSRERRQQRRVIGADPRGHIHGAADHGRVERFGDVARARATGRRVRELDPGPVLDDAGHGRAEPHAADTPRELGDHRSCPPARHEKVAFRQVARPDISSTRPMQSVSAICMARAIGEAMYASISALPRRRQ